MLIYNQRLAHQDLSEKQLADIEQQGRDNHYLYLDFDTRQRSRFKAQTQNGIDIGIDLPRTQTLKDGSILSSDDGQLIEIKAADQSLVAVTANDGFTLMKGAYHLGNRHVPLMITPQTLYFEPDHVLESMLQNLGLTVQSVQSPFEPETGAYKTANAHSHAQSHSHSHDASSSHTHSSSHGHADD